ncbi:HPr kinase/phosphorylase [Rhizorhabdus sp.]|uniref:HPr kinase/phosphorylase n=1 Tax=Rhizorhabdus sp. TaxID=1968843 RepID=UPI0019C95AAC|nr:HPr kinase/phosphatase C-terminal domain-containing protein [Rhizorhabdus sp.]MBD3760079.1 HPr kinase/phosphatase C-terminal domain-containing protein [Rhizorhabdus sp.]
MTLRSPVHASSVMIDGRVLLLRGRPGVGKSDLALRLIDRGALLIADDYTQLERRGMMLIASPPPAIAGKIEIRGLGIVEMAFAAEGPVALLLDLDAAPERLSEDPPASTDIEGVAIPTLRFAAIEASAPIKAEYALKHYGLRVPS